MASMQALAYVKTIQEDSRPEIFLSLPGGGGLSHSDKFSVQLFSATLDPALIESLSGAYSSLGIGIGALLGSGALPAIAIIAGGYYYINQIVEQYEGLAEDAEKIRAWTYEMVETGGIERKNWRDNLVYVMENTRTNEVDYAGITSNYDKRHQAHQLGSNPVYPEKDYNMVVVASGLERREARALEQSLIIAFTIDALNNAINSIAEKNLPGYVEEFIRIRKLWKVDP